MCPGLADWGPGRRSVRLNHDLDHDQTLHTGPASREIATGHVPHGVANEPGESGSGTGSD